MDQALNEIIARVRDAGARRTPLRLRGGGTKDFFGLGLQGEVLDTTPLAGVVSYEPSELVITVGAGTPLADVEAQLAARGQCLPFDPPHFAWSGSGRSTVGGMVAAGLSGPARASVGSVRDYVLGVKIVNGLGQHLTFGGQVMKNVAGYDVSRLMAGAMGTLGLLTEVSLKVLPIAPGQATLRFVLPQASALEQLHRWGGQPLPLNASCWRQEGTEPALYVRLSGAVAAVEAACTAMQADQAGQRMVADHADRFWSQCRNQGLSFFAQPLHPGMRLWRLSLPQTAPVLAVPGDMLVEWHGGLRWLWAPPDAAVAVQSAARAAGGSAMPFIASPALSTASNGLFDPENKALLAIHHRLKASFDPLGIFNPGRWLAGK